jgi:hypothetical protein
MRYLILYRRGRNDWTRLEQFVHAKIYRIPEIDAAVQALLANPTFDGVSLRVGQEQFNVIRDLSESPDSFVVEAPAC